MPRRKRIAQEDLDFLEKFVPKFRRSPKHLQVRFRDILERLQRNEPSGFNHEFRVHGGREVARLNVHAKFPVVRSLRVALKVRKIRVDGVDRAPHRKVRIFHRHTWDRENLDRGDVIPLPEVEDVFQQHGETPEAFAMILREILRILMVELEEW